MPTGTVMVMDHPQPIPPTESITPAPTMAEPVLPTVDDLRAMASDLDDIDETLARLDANPDGDLDAPDLEDADLDDTDLDDTGEGPEPGGPIGSS